MKLFFAMIYVFLLNVKEYLQLKTYLSLIVN
jgi:hypothetical protein